MELNRFTSAYLTKWRLVFVDWAKHFEVYWQKEEDAKRLQCIASQREEGLKVQGVFWLSDRLVIHCEDLGQG